MGVSALFPRTQIWGRERSVLFPVELALSLAILGIPTAVWNAPPNSPYQSMGLLMAKSLCLACSAFLLAIAIGRIRLEVCHLDRYLALYFILGLLSAYANHLTAGVWIPWLSLEIGALLLYLGSGALFRTASTERLSILFQKLFLLQSIAVTLLLVCFFAEINGVTFPWGAIRRPVSLIGNRNFFAAYLALSAPLIAARALKTGSPWQAILLGIVLAASLSLRCRSVLMGYLMVGGVFFCLTFPKVKSYLRENLVFLGTTLTSFGITVFFLLAVAWPGLRWKTSQPFFERALSHIDTQRGTGRERRLQNLLALSILKKHPLLGAGPRSWPKELPQFLGTSDWRIPRNGLPAVPNSEFARILSEFGLAGLVLLLTILSATLKAYHRALQKQPRLSVEWNAVFLSLALIAANGFFESPLARIETLAVGAILLGSLRQFSQQTFRRLSFSKSASFSLGLVALLGPCGRVVEMSRWQTPDPSESAWHLSTPLNPFGTTQYLLSRLDQKSGSCRQVELPLSERLQAFPFDRDIHWALGRCAEERNDTWAAQSHYLAAWKADPQENGLITALQRVRETSRNPHAPR